MNGAVPEQPRASASRTTQRLETNGGLVRRGRMLARGALLCASLLSGCATNSVTTLLKASSQTDPVLPSAAVVQDELKGRAFEVGAVTFDPDRASETPGPDIPDSAYLELLEGQLRKAFEGARLEQGTLPAYPVNVAVERLQLKPARFPIPETSVLRVRMEIVRPGSEVLMRGQFQSFVSSPTVMIIGGGVVLPVSLPSKNWEYVALAKMFPAVAIVIAVTAQGLQQGRTLDEIKVYPKDIEAGTMISPDLFLQHAPFGMTQMDYKEMSRVIQAAKEEDKR